MKTRTLDQAAATRRRWRREFVAKAEGYERMSRRWARWSPRLAGWYARQAELDWEQILASDSWPLSDWQ